MSVSVEKQVRDSIWLGIANRVRDGVWFGAQVDKSTDRIWGGVRVKVRVAVRDRVWVKVRSKRYE